MNPRMKKLLLLLLLTVFCITESKAQLYTVQQRPAAQNWQQLTTEHFIIIYPAGAESEAIRTGVILELEYPKIQQLVGGRLDKFPFILNSANDLSNGFVTPINFRSEVELPPIKGKALNPASGDWLETVVPHELVHALHMNVVQPNSLISLIGLFSPDLRRSIHTAAPLGILEGIAVEHESHGTLAGAGRGNYPFFTHQFNVNLNSPDRWSMGQLVHISSSTIPFNRHYIGGYEFVNYLQNEYGEETLKRTIAYHFRWPFLGFGFALRKTTGKYTSALYKDFSAYHKSLEDERLSLISNSTNDLSSYLDIPFKGVRANRPVWFNDDTVLYYSRAYNAPSGFYIWRSDLKKPELFHEAFSTEDFIFSISDDRSVLWYSTYNTSRIYDNTFTADINRLDLKTGKAESITRRKRVFSPSEVHGSLYALQSSYYLNNPVIVDEDSGEIIRDILIPDGFSIIQIESHPVDLSKTAVLAQKGSVRGIWLGNPENIYELLNTPPHISFLEGSLFDLHWNSSGSQLLFTSDHTGVMNVFEFNLNENTVTQLTQSLYNVFEASYSPDGQRIVFITNHSEQDLPAILHRDHFYNHTLPEQEWVGGSIFTITAARPVMDNPDQPDIQNWEIEKYKTGLSWLLPRTWLPFMNEVSPGLNEFGVNLMSADPLSRHSYDMTITSVQDRLWFDMDYNYSGFYPGFGLRLYNRPSFPFIRENVPGSNRGAQFLLQDTGVGLNIPIRFYFERGPRFSSLTIRPEYRLSAVRFYRLRPSDVPLTNYDTIHSIGVSSVLNLRLRQYTRDLQPNAGFTFFAQADADLNSLDFSFTYFDAPFAGTFVDRKALRVGMFTYVSPLQRFNQSLRLGGQVITQGTFLRYNTASLISNIFEPGVFQGSRNISILSTRYTIPLIHADDGGFLLPLYLANVYMVAFSQTVADLNSGDSYTVMNTSRTAIGVGIRTQFRLSNLMFDIGFAVGYEPSRNNIRYIFGDF